MGLLEEMRSQCVRCWRLSALCPDHHHLADLAPVRDEVDALKAEQLVVVEIGRKVLAERDDFARLLDALRESSIKRVADLVAERDAAVKRAAFLERWQAWTREAGNRLCAEDFGRSDHEPGCYAAVVVPIPNQYVCAECAVWLAQNPEPRESDL